MSTESCTTTSSRIGIGPIIQNESLGVHNTTDCNTKVLEVIGVSYILHHVFFSCEELFKYKIHLKVTRPFFPGACSGTVLILGLFWKVSEMP